MEMEKWYDLFSFWVIILFLLYKLNIIKFSILPSVLLAIVGAFIIFFIKVYLDIPMNLQFILFVVIILHMFPLFLIPYKNNLTSSDITNNLVIIIIYLLFLLIRNKNVFNVYKNIVYENNNTSLMEYPRRRGLIK